MPRLLYSRSVPSPGLSLTLFVPTLWYPRAMTVAPDPLALLADARRELARLPVIVPALLDGLDHALWRARPAPDEWAPVEIVCHLRDEEVEDFGARVRVILNGGDAFERIDPPRWAIERRYREAEPERALAALLERRAASLEFLGRVEASRLERAIEPPQLGRMSGLDLVAAWVTHDRLHLAQLAATLARTGADRWAPLRAEYAGPVPYPP